MFIVKYLFDEKNHIIRQREFNNYKSAYIFAKNKSKISDSVAIHINSLSVVEFEFGVETYNNYKTCPNCYYALRFVAPGYNSETKQPIDLYICPFCREEFDFVRDYTEQEQFEYISSILKL